MSDKTDPNELALAVGRALKIDPERVRVKAADGFISINVPDDADSPPSDDVLHVRVLVEGRGEFRPMSIGYDVNQTPLKTSHASVDSEGNVTLHPGPAPSGPPLRCECQAAAT